MDWYLEVRDLSRETICVLLAYLLIQEKKDHKDPEYIDYSVPRLARYLQNTSKRHQDTVVWIDIDLGIREGLEVLSDKIERNYSSRNTTSKLHCEKLKD